MLRLKYYDGIRAAQAKPIPRGPGETPEFDFDAPTSSGLAALFFRLVTSLIPLAFWFFRTFWPNPQFGRLIIVTREEDVCAVLKDDTHFETPFALEMTELGGGTNSVLGMEDQPHSDLRAIIQEALRPEDLPGIRKAARETAQGLIRNAAGRLDVVADLITRCATESCARYFGLDVDDPVAFADWTMAVSSMLFADPFGNPEIRRRGLYGSIRLQELVDRGIAAAHRRKDQNIPADTLVDRFVTMQPQYPKTLSDHAIRATLIGLMTGFVPTNTLAAGKMLEELLDRPDAWALARDAARGDDFDALHDILMEAGRLNPALNPGQWRYCRAEGVIAKGAWRQKTVRKNSVLLVAISSALRDGRKFKNPGAFDPKRKQCPDLIFGFGPHSCLGKHVAMAQITEVFLALLALDDLKPADGPEGRLQSMDAFPRRMDMTFAPPAGAALGVQALVTICLPLGKGAEACRVSRAIAEMGNPAGAEMREALTGAGVIHFASLSCVDVGDEGDPRHMLLLELNGDGSEDSVLEAFAEAAPPKVHSIVADATGRDEALLDTLRRGRQTLTYLPWGVTGLKFNGTPEFAVPEIERDRHLADFARRALDNYLQNHVTLARPMLALRYVRDLILKDHAPASAATNAAVRGVANLAAEGRQFRADLAFPSRRKLQIAEFVDIDQKEAFWRFLKSPDARPFEVLALAIWLVLAAGIYISVAPRLGAWTAPDRVLLSLAASFVAEAMGAGVFALALAVTLRWKETHDVPDIRYPDLEQLKRATAPENHPGFAQNHITATPALKPGWFRRLTLAVGLYSVGMLVKHWFRPGFVVNMGTIHYARWYRAPKTNRLIFLSNYDGSWESYLEDFITKAHPGQTLAWSNCVGFPETRYLQFDGAQDGDHFKRWVRRQQVATQFWFSRFPDLTTDQVRNNALIRDGLARATTDTAARAWLACFGSMQRPESTLETDQVQSVMFSGFGRLAHAAYALLRLPDDKAQLAAWLKSLARAQDKNDPRPPDPRLGVTFGDAPAGRAVLDEATVVAFSARGLARLGLPQGEDGDGLATFPGVFRMGMAERGRVLGDVGEEAPRHWRWSDAEADGVLVVYGKSERKCRALLKRHAAKLGGSSAFLDVVMTQPPPGHRGVDVEPFGFRDGISQPILRGTQRFARAPAPEDVLEPGEFILGYKSGQGYFPPSPVVGAETDPLNDLATAVADSPRRFPVFASNPEAQEFHDFGRNGAYLVLRLLEQDVDGFRAFTKETAKTLNLTYDLKTLLGSPVDEEWVAAKIIGRWRNGATLIDRPNRPPDRPPNPLVNDFAFGVDDPGGLRCPLGSHVRRTNPRDSFSPGDAEARTIVNRHRLLRRGRPYALERNGETEQGLVFACLCADLERQFEFVQQTWVRSPNFHGLNSESDPMLGGPGRRMTIPTMAGALEVQEMQTFVSTRAGGYFFMPSHSALRYLLRRMQQAPGG